MDYVEKARALRADPAVHYNCCQAVLVTFADRLGLTPELWGPTLGPGCVTAPPAAR